MKTLERLLAQLGFDEIQGKIYSELYFHGPSTVLELSRLTSIKRPTVHFHIEQLLEKKIVSETVKAGRRVVVAEDPGSFVSLVEEKKQAIRETEESLGKVLSEVSSLSSRESNRGIAVLVDEGIEAVKNIYREAFEYGDIYSYFDADKGKELHSIRTQFFDSIALRKLLTAYEELYYTQDSFVPLFVKKMRGFEHFSFSKTGVRLYGNAVNIVTYGQVVAIITKEADWKVMKITQPILAIFVREMVDAQVV